MSAQEALKDMAAFFKNEDQRKATSESGATHIENMVRSEAGIPLRQTYNDGKGGTYYDLNKTNYNYNQPHNIHQYYNVSPIRRRRGRR